MESAIDQGKRQASLRNAPIIVVKIGGSTLGSRDTTLEDLVALQRNGSLPVVVHGGGKDISRWQEKMGLKARFVRGLRVTDEESLGVVVAVLAGVVNKGLVAGLVSLGGKAMGLSGADGGLVQARVRDPELGLVGEITRIDPAPLMALLEAGYIPVIAPIGIQEPGQGNGSSLLNINADTVAGEIAAALKATSLVFLTDVEGVLDTSGKLLPRLAAVEARGVVASGTASGGMIPKVEACLRALAGVPSALIVDGRVAHALLDGLEGRSKGTVIERGTGLA